MPLLDIIHIPDPLLRSVSKPVERVDDEVRKLLEDMAETMYHAPGIGIAAIQVAVPLRAVIVDCAEREKREAELTEDGVKPARAQVIEAIEENADQEKEEERNPIFLINPEIVSFSDDVSVCEEGCLSIPDYFADVERPADCVVEYIDLDGKKQTLEASGLLSTVIQHEVDHMDGKLFIDHISKLKRDRVIKKFTKIAKQHGIEPAKPLLVG